MRRRGQGRYINTRWEIWLFHGHQGKLSFPLSHEPATVIPGPSPDLAWAGRIRRRIQVLEG
jgi:hypothetical protein